MTTATQPTREHILAVAADHVYLPFDAEERFIEQAMDMWNDTLSDLTDEDRQHLDEVVANIETEWAQLAEEIAANWHDPNYHYDG